MDPVIMMNISLYIVGIIIVFQFGWVLSVFHPIIQKFFYMRKKPWTDYNMNAINRIIHHFAVNPKGVKFKFNGEIISQWNSNRLDNGDSGMALGLFSRSNGGNIELDTKLLRNHRSVTKTLLHEICHWNQWQQGRFMIELLALDELNIDKAIKARKAMEREAEGFAKAWIKTAWIIYKNTPKETKSDGEKTKETQDDQS